jgi:hypothetical protein
MTNSTFSLSPLLERLKIVITDPSGCWATVSADSRDAKALVKDFAVPMAVIEALVAMVPGFLFGRSPGFGVMLVGIVLVVIGRVAGALLAGFVAQQVASLMGTQVSFDRTFSWLLHASMVGFVGSLFGFLPAIGILVALASWVGSIYVLVQGTEPMIPVPAEKRALFVAGTVIATIGVVLVLYVAAGFVVLGLVGGMSGAVTG